MKEGPGEKLAENEIDKETYQKAISREEEREINEHGTEHEDDWETLTEDPTTDGTPEGARRKKKADGACRRECKLRKSPYLAFSSRGTKRKKLANRMRLNITTLRHGKKHTGGGRNTRDGDDSFSRKRGEEAEAEASSPCTTTLLGKSPWRVRRAALMYKEGNKQELTSEKRVEGVERLVDALSPTPLLFRSKSQQEEFRRFVDELRHRRRRSL